MEYNLVLIIDFVKTVFLSIKFLHVFWNWMCRLISGGSHIWFVSIFLLSLLHSSLRFLPLSHSPTQSSTSQLQTRVSDGISGSLLYGNDKDTADPITDSFPSTTPCLHPPTLLALQLLAVRAQATPCNLSLSSQVWETEFRVYLLLFSCQLCPTLCSLMYARSPCPSPSLGVCPSSWPLHQWCHPVISSSDTLFSFCPQSFPASGTPCISHHKIISSIRRGTVYILITTVYPVHEIMPTYSKLNEWMVTNMSCMCAC